VLAEVGDGEAAVEAVRTLSPDVVLLDLVMPGMGGVDCLKRLKEVNSDLKVLMLTSSDIGSDVRAAIGAGADGYVTKTVSSVELVDAIQAVAGGSRCLSEEVKRLLEESELTAELTPRELEVLQLLRKGMSNPDIGSLLGITPRTAKAHVAALLVKLQAQDRAEAVARGFERGLLRP
jgi:DNA-binding NarL/FixJ family response regulator